MVRTPCAHCQTPSPCPSSIPGWGTKIPQDMWQKKKRKKERKEKKKKEKTAKYLKVGLQRHSGVIWII